MLMCIDIYTNLDDTFKYTNGDDGFWIVPPDKYNFHISNTYFIDPRMDNEELSNILAYARSYVATRGQYFKVNKNDAILETEIENKLEEFFINASMSLRLHDTSNPTGFTPIERLVRNCMGAHSYSFSSDIPIFMRITFMEDASFADASNSDIGGMIDTLYHSVTDIEHLRKYVVQLFTDIIMADGHTGVQNRIKNILERCWE